uniref:Uncharacterized protein n=1 Tax=Onchocerca volvulus TaxID=6282 RepID=A0A8R1TZM1_ONCVO
MILSLAIRDYSKNENGNKSVGEMGRKNNEVFLRFPSKHHYLLYKVGSMSSFERQLIVNKKGEENITQVVKKKKQVVKRKKNLPLKLVYIDRKCGQV